MRLQLVSCSTQLVKYSLKLTNRCPIIASTSSFHAGNGFSTSYELRNSVRIVPQNPWITGRRLVRTRYSDDKDKQGVHHNTEGSENEKNESSDSEKQEETQQKKVDPALIKKLRIYVLVVAGLSFVSSFLLLSQMFTGDRNIADGLKSEDFTRPGIPFDRFINSYLSRGEVKRIVFAPESKRAIAILFPGAVVDGKHVNEQSIIVEYPQNAQQFWADIRKAEGELGIGLAQGVQIDLYQGMTTFKLFELLIGVTILAFLGTQYGRLLRKRLLENRAKSETKK